MQQAKMKQVCSIERKYVPPDILESQEPRTVSVEQPRASNVSVRAEQPPPSLYVETGAAGAADDGVATSSSSSPSLLDQHPDNEEGEDQFDEAPPPAPLLSSSFGRKSPIGTARLKRKSVSLTDSVPDTTAVQRLVEYFCVISVKTTNSRTPKAGNQRKTNTTPRSSGNAAASEGSEGDLKDSAKSKPAGSGEECASLEEILATAMVPKPISPPNSLRSSGGNEFLVFTPKITARYPQQDYKDNPLNPMIISFCFPTGADDIQPTKTYQLPRVHYFALTNEKGRKVYGICLTFMEEYHPDERWAQHHQNDTTVKDSTTNQIEVSMKADKDPTPPLYLPKVLCITSTWPYLTAFREYLAQLYRLATATNVMTAPIERYIVNLCSEIPAPPPGAYEIQLEILNSKIRFWAPPANLPIAYVALPYHILFECLDLDHVLDLFCALLMENKIVLLSSQYSILTICSEILCSLLFPMRWSHLYVPILPKMLCPMLDAPVPFICGVIRDNWAYAQDQVATDAVVVDLDNNKITLGRDTQTIPSPPAKKWSKLHSTLQQSLGNIFQRAHGHDLSVNLNENSHSSMLRKNNLRQTQTTKLRATKDSPVWQEKLESWDFAYNLAYTPDSDLMDDYIADQIPGIDGQTQWDKVQEAFLRFFTAMFKDYRTYLTVSTPSGSLRISNRPAFDVVGFLESQPPVNRPFMQAMCMTQQFDDFITRRMYSPGEPELQFFDQSIDAKLNRSRLKLKKVETPFVQNAKAHKVLKKINAIEPNEDGLSEFNFDRILDPYIYKTWPDSFDEKLFSRPRPLPQMITDEFDRQAMHVSQLRIIESNELEEDEVEFFGGDYDLSPEVGAFTVYFFVYSALVGVEWRRYKENALQLQRKASGDSDGSREEREDPEPYLESVETIMAGDIAPYNPAYPCDDQCVSDLTMGLCSNPKGFSSTMVFVNKGAEDAYVAFFKDAAERMQKLQRTLSNDNGEHPEQQEEAVIEYEEAREVASAQLDLAFETLKTLSLRGLPADLDAYKSLMEACGRCGEAQRAQGLIELMKKDGFVLDGEILSCFVAAFAHEEAADPDDVGLPPDEIKQMQLSPRRNRDAYTASIEKSLVKLQEKGDDNRPWLNFGKFGKKQSDDDLDDTASVKSSETDGSYGSSIIFGWMSSGEPRSRKEMQNRRRRRRRFRMTKDKKVTPMLATQLDLGQAILECLYPELQIDTNKQSCPHCSYTLTEDEVIAGWTPCSFDDFTTKCSKCGHRFVPHFSVSCKEPSFKGSQGPGSALFCEFLSPWVVRKALHHVVKGDVGIEGMLDPEWRNGTDIRATLFWNLIVMCRRYNLPCTFLLQGSVEGRIILPRLPTDM